MDKNYLIHYGILGQQWGVRNGPPYPLSSDRKSSEEKHYNLKARDVKKNMDSMSDAELQRAINRLNMQQQVDRMNPNYVERGRKLLDQYKKDLGLVAGTITVSTGLITALSKLY